MNDEALSVAVSHNGLYVATGGTATVVKLWKFNGAELILEGAGHSGTITGLRQARRATRSRLPVFGSLVLIGRSFALAKGRTKLSSR